MRGLEAVLLAAAMLSVALPAGADQHGTTTFDWSTREALGNTVVRLDLTLDENTGSEDASSECTFTFGVGGSENEGGGPMLLHYIETDDEVLSSAVTSTFRSQSAHVGDTVDNRKPIRVADTVTVFPNGEFGANTKVDGPFPAGELHVTVGGVDLHSTDEDPSGLGYHSLSISITCETAFTVHTYAAGHEWLGFRSNTMDGGAGAYYSLAADVAIGDHVEKTFASPEVISHVSWREYQEGAHTGEFTRTTPDGTRTVDLDEEPTGRIDDVTGAGTHRYDLTRAGLDFFSSFWGIAYGLGPVDSLDDVLPDEGT